MRNRDAIMIVGCGELGGILLEYLCRVPNIGRIVVADINEDAVQRKVNSAVHGASFAGLYPDISHRTINLLDQDYSAALLAEINPCVIFNGTTLQSWWVVNEIPQELNARLYLPRVGLGAWVPMHLALTAKLMSAIKVSGINTHVVNSSFPDVTNVALSKIGMAPTVGIGNGSLLLPYIKKAAAAILDIPRCNIHVDLIAHHYHCYNWARSGTGTVAPHYLRVYDGSKDITNELGTVKDFVAKLPQYGARPGGRGGQFVVAASSLRNILDIYFDTNALGMAPGPLGLEGAYPVRLSRKGAELALPADISKEQARTLMLEAQQFDGIGSIEDNGDIRLTDEVAALYKKEFNIEWSIVTVKDSYEQAMELRKKFLEFLDRNGVSAPK
jgi:hypothetical protein